MAEFCLECWNKINKTHSTQGQFILSRGKEMCEECCTFQRVIVAERFWSRVQRVYVEMIIRKSKR